MFDVFKGRQLSNHLIRINLSVYFFHLASFLLHLVLALGASSPQNQKIEFVQMRSSDSVRVASDTHTPIFFYNRRGEYHYTMSTMLHSIWRSIDALQFMMFNLIYSLHWQHYLHKIYIDGDNLIIISEWAWASKWHRRLIIIFTCEHMHMVGENTIYATVEINRMQQWTLNAHRRHQSLLNEAFSCWMLATVATHNNHHYFLGVQLSGYRGYN